MNKENYINILRENYKNLMNIEDKYRFLHELRNEYKITQEVLASKAGISRRSLGKIERGEKIPTIEEVIRIVEAIDYRLLNRDYKCNNYKIERIKQFFYIKDNKEKEITDKEIFLDMLSTYYDDLIKLQKHQFILQEIREDIGVKQEYLANKVHKTRSSLSLIERGKRMVSLEETIKIVDAINPEILSEGYVYYKLNTEKLERYFSMLDVIDKIDKQNTALINALKHIYFFGDVCVKDLSVQLSTLIDYAPYILTDFSNRIENFTKLMCSKEMEQFTKDELHQYNYFFRLDYELEYLDMYEDYENMTEEELEMLEELRMAQLDLAVVIKYNIMLIFSDLSILKKNTDYYPNRYNEYLERFNI